MKFYNVFFWFMFLVIAVKKVIGDDSSYTINRDGSYKFDYTNPDSYHVAVANRNNVVKGEFGGRNPGTGAIDSVSYTAGPRGFRPRGKNIARKYDLNQSGPRPVGSPDDPNYDPFEDPSYNFSFKTRTYNREENANRVGDVSGRYSYTDDIGERHNVEFIAGKNTGFHVKTPFPDSNPRAYGPLYFNGRGKPIPRGRTSIQRGLDGSYRFVSAGPDQRRTETSDASGRVRGSYTYLDDKGVQHSVHYIAGPGIGYRIIKNVKGPHLPAVFPFGHPEIIPPDFYEYEKGNDLFDTAASGHFKPSSGKPDSNKDTDFDKDTNKDEFTFGNKKPVRPSSKPPSASFGEAAGSSSFEKPLYTDDEDTEDFGDLFGDTPSSGVTSSIGGSLSTTTTSRPRPTLGQKPSVPSKSEEKDDGSYKLSSEDNSFRPIPTRPSFGNLPRPGGLGVTSTTIRPRPTPSGVKPSRIPGSNTDTDYEEGYGSGKPISDFGGASNEVGDNFSLFGSESSNSRPPYGNRPVIHVGGTDESCKRCAGTIVTNVGDKLFSVPPGVSVRAHVQAIDLLPISPSVPSPSEQYKFDTSRRTEQLNEASNRVVSTNDTEKSSEKTTTEAPTTTLVPST